jgi:predicted nucleic acid-binding protein
MAEMLLRLILDTNQWSNLYLKNNEAQVPTSRRIYFLIYVCFVFVGMFILIPYNDWSNKKSVKIPKV